MITKVSILQKAAQAAIVANPTLGYRADVIEAALAHIQGEVRGVYNRSVSVWL